MIGKYERGDTGDSIMFVTLLVCIFWGGAAVFRFAYSEELAFYNKYYEPEYQKCISKLPRNQDCRYDSMNFKIVTKK